VRKVLKLGFRPFRREKRRERKEKRKKTRDAVDRDRWSFVLSVLYTHSLSGHRRPAEG